MSAGAGQGLTQARAAVAAARNDRGFGAPPPCSLRPRKGVFGKSKSWKGSRPKGKFGYNSYDGNGKFGYDSYDGKGKFGMDSYACPLDTSDAADDLSHALLGAPPRS